MNANELADNLNDGDVSYITMDKAATMLRQQQVKIEQLLETQDYLYKKHDEQQAEIEALKLRVGAVKLTNSQLVDLVQLHREEAEKMRNEILAWENAEVPAEVMAETIVELEKRGFITHPAEHDLGIAEAIGFEKGYKAASVKELTDEEILKMASDYLHYTEFKQGIQFARAILKKASEK